MDIVTLALAKKSAKQYTDDVVEGLGKGIVYKGAVNYYNDLPNNASIGDCYSILYKGTGGTDPSGAEYVWGKIDNTAQWIKLGEETDLTDYVKNTDYATASQGGTIVLSSGALLRQNGTIYAEERTYENYQTSGNTLFIGKGTLENVITGKGLINNTSYASSNTAGVIKTTPGYNLNINNNNGVMYCSSNDYATYQTKDNGAFISKGTLENVLAETVGNIGETLDAIQGEVI